jgi:hypothetical protein
MAQGDTPQPRVFTLEEANELLPRLRSLLQDLRSARERLLDAQSKLADRIHGGARTNGHVTPGGEVDQLNATSREAQADLGRAVAEIASLGCELKDPEQGMVDFRTMREGRIVYLCWLIHEPEVLYWHEIDGGYRGRQPL